MFLSLFHLLLLTYGDLRSADACTILEEPGRSSLKNLIHSPEVGNLGSLEIWGTKFSYFFVQRADWPPNSLRSMLKM